VKENGEEAEQIVGSIENLTNALADAIEDSTNISPQLQRNLVDLCT
jgi:hypothetical protein